MIWEVSVFDFYNTRLLLLFAESRFDELSSFFEPSEPFGPLWFGIPYWIVLSVVLLAVWTSMIDHPHDPKP